MRTDQDHATARGNNSADGRAALSDRVRSLRLAERPAGQRGGSRGGFLPWALVAVLLLTTAIFGLKAFRAPPAPAEEPAVSTARSPAEGTTPTAATASTGDIALESRGYVIAAHSIQLSPQVGGEIVWLDPDFKEGAVYQKGAKLAEIDPVIYAAQLKSAQANLAVARTNQQQVESGSTLKDIEAMEASVKNLAAKLELAQLDENFNRAAGLGASRSDLEKSMVQVKIDRAALESQRQTLAKMKLALEEQRLITKAQVQRAEADLQQAEKQLRNCTIVAPTTGIILSKKAELGGYVNPLAFGAAGYLCEMADLCDLEVDLSIQERDIDKVFKGQDCVVRPEAFINSETFKGKHPEGYHGRVSRLMPVADRSKGSVSVRVAIDREQIPHEEAGFFLRPDMSVLVWFKKGKP
jgi:multidrug resistance efflux pump